MRGDFPINGKGYRYFSGKIGLTNVIELVNNLVSLVNLATVAKATVLGTEAGADPEILFRVMSSGISGSWVVENKLPKIAKGDFTSLKAERVVQGTHRFWNLLLISRCLFLLQARLTSFTGELKLQDWETRTVLH